MQNRTKQYLIIIVFSLMSIFVYKHGVNIDRGTLSISANVSNYSYKVGRNQFECATNRCSQILKPNNYVLIVSKDGFLDYQTEVEVSQQHENEIEINLETIPSTKEIDASEFKLETFVKDNFIVHQDLSSERKILALDPQRTLSSFSYNQKDKNALVVYDKSDVYFYDLKANESYKLQLPINFQPNQVRSFTNNSLLITNSDDQVFQGFVKEGRLELNSIKVINSIDHFLPTKNGYLAVLPSGLDQSQFNLADILTDQVEYDEGPLTNQDIKSKYEKVDKALFYYSLQSKRLKRVLDLSLESTKEVGLLTGVTDKNSTPILKLRKGFYKIEL